MRTPSVSNLLPCLFKLQITIVRVLIPPSSLPVFFFVRMWLFVVIPLDAGGKSFL